MGLAGVGYQPSNGGAVEEMSWSGIEAWEEL